MNNIKKFFLYTAIIIATTHTSSRAGRVEDFWNAFKAAFSPPKAAGVAMVQEIDQVLTTHTQSVKDVSALLGSEGAKEIGEKIKEGIANGAQNIDPTLGNQAAGTLGDKVKEASPMLGREAAEILAPALKYLGAGIAIYGISQLASTANDVYRSYYPDEETKARIKTDRETNEYLDAKQGLRNCFIKNAHTPRNWAGRPTACDEFSRQYTLVAGKAALNEMTTNFKTAYQD